LTTAVASSMPSEKTTPSWPPAVLLLWVQGLYFLLFGVWPLVSIRSFQLVTGPKTDHLPTGRESDHWLVMTAGVLITAVGAALLAAAWRRRASPEITVLAIGAAIGLAAIDVIYVARQVIGPIYLVDAAIEAVFLAGWLAALLAAPCAWRPAAREWTANV
jgi:hypothetical protein